MITKEYTGKNVKQALKQAETELGIGKDEFEFEVLEEGKGGLLGFGSSKEARIRIRFSGNIPVDADSSEAYKNAATKFIEELFQKMDIDITIDVVEIEGGKLFIQFSSDSSALIIGRRGKTLEAIQMLTNIVAAKQTVPNMKTVLDIENYRGKRETVLTDLALKIADEVRTTGRSRSLEPMNPFERRLIHIALQGVSDVDTRSEGEGAYRKVVVVPKK